MTRPVTLCTGQWADLPLETLAPMAKSFGFDGLELACFGDHFEVDKALADPGYCERQRELLSQNDLQVFSISNHLVGQAVLDPVDQRHKSILPEYVWGDGDPAGVNPTKFIRTFPDRIFHVHMKDAIVTLDGESGILASHLDFGDPRRGWDFRSVGRGGVDFEEIIRALNDAGYTGPLSVEWEDSGMDREHGAKEALEHVKRLDFTPSQRAFDAAFDN